MGASPALHIKAVILINGVSECVRARCYRNPVRILCVVRLAPTLPRMLFLRDKGRLHILGKALLIKTSSTHRSQTELFKFSTHFVFAYLDCRAHD